MHIIRNSASRIVFLALTFSVCTAFLFEVFKGAITLDPKDFYAIVLMAFTYYFSKPASPVSQSSSEETIPK